MREFPKDWVSAPLGNLATQMLSGGTPSTKRADYWSGSIPWITSKWLGEPIRLASGEKYISPSALADSATNIVPAGNLIYATRVGVGKVAVNEIDLAINQDLAGIVVDQRKALPEFLAYQLRTNRVKSYVDGNKRGATIQGITKACVREIEIALPPLNEQRQVAAVLYAVQRAIERQERLIALTAELKKAVMHKLFNEGIRGGPLKQTEIGPIPRSWQAVKLADAVDYIDYGISAPIPKTAPPGGVKIVSTADITKDGEILYGKIRRLIAPARTVQRLTLKQGDVLFNWRNSSELIGKSAVFEEQGERHVFASFILRIRCDEVRLHNKFLSYLMNHYREQGVFINLSRRAVNQANYNRNEISVLGIPLPSIDEQHEIARTITTVVNVRSVHERQRDALRRIFATLLQQLMNAQIRVQDLDLSALEGAEREAVAAV
jgi:type I restriction enzyme S subunit